LQEKKKQYGFYLYNLHLDHRSSKSRRKSVLLLIDRIIKRDHKFPVIITGDFNVGERNAVIKYLSGKVTHGVHNEKCPIDLVDVHRVVNQKLFCGTYNHFRGYRFGPRIDVIFAETAIEVHSSKIIRTEFNGRYASDHFPVQAVLQLP
jgi:endonuclease/exonuclease/phosphatase family metal-dependent hydrolase